MIPGRGEETDERGCMPMKNVQAKVTRLCKIVIKSKRF